MKGCMRLRTKYTSLKEFGFQTKLRPSIYKKIATLRSTSCPDGNPPNLTKISWIYQFNISDL